jgi:hypothetical protein
VVLAAETVNRTQRFTVDVKMDVKLVLAISLG